MRDFWRTIFSKIIKDVTFLCKPKLMEENYNTQLCFTVVMTIIGNPNSRAEVVCLNSQKQVDAVSSG